MTTSITIDDKQLKATLRRLESAAVDLTPAMRKIAGALALVVEDNFAADGRPKWKPLAEATVHARIGGSKAYKKNGTLKASAQRKMDGMRILQHTGSLAASVITSHNASEAIIGSNKIYAAIQQFGGQAGRGKKVTIPARPFLPLDQDGTLQPAARTEVLDTVLRHLRTAAGV